MCLIHTSTVEKDNLPLSNLAISEEQPSNQAAKSNQRQEAFCNDNQQMIDPDSPNGSLHIDLDGDLMFSFYFFQNTKRLYFIFITR